MVPLIHWGTKFNVFQNYVFSGICSSNSLVLDILNLHCKTSFSVRIDLGHVQFVSIWNCAYRMFMSDCIQLLCA